MGRIAFRKDYNPPVFRKVAYATWKTASDPSVYAQVDIDMTKALKFCEEYSKTHNVKVTPTHLVARAITMSMVARPEINGMLRRGKIYLREKVALFFQVNVPGSGVDKTKGASLSGTTLHDCENLSLADIARRLTKNATDVKNNKDPAFNQTLQTVKLMPWGIVRPFLLFSMWLLYELNLDLSFLGLPKDPFGSCMITNVGSLGIDMAWAPLCPYTRVPLLLTLGTIQDKVVAVNGKVEIRPILPMGVTLDHRLIDGVHAAQMSRDFKKCFDDPEKYFT